MLDVDSIKASGIVEAYCLGQLEGEELKKFVGLIAAFPNLDEEVRRVQMSLISKSKPVRMAINEEVRREIFDKIRSLTEPRPSADFLPELIGPGSCHEHWLAKTSHHVFPDQKDPIHLIPLQMEEKTHQYLAWVKEEVEEEIHTERVESFLLLKGSCTCRLGDRFVHLEAGSFLEIPLNQPHSIKVTSPDGIFAILQRIYL